MDIFTAQSASVAFNADDTRVLLKLPGELADVYVDRVDARCAALQEAVGEAAGGGAHIEANASCGIDGEIIEGAFELETSTAREFLRTAGDFDAGICGHRHASLVCGRAIYLDFASEDQSKSFLRSAGETAFDKEKVEPLAACLGFHGAFESSGAAKDEILRDLAEARGASGIRSEFGDRSCSELPGDFVGALKAIHRWVGRFLLRDVFAGGLAESSGGFLDVEDVVGDLKSPANR